MAYVDNEGIRIHYEVEGSGPPLVLHHGFSASLDVWRDYGYVDELNKNYQVILVDARGHGTSGKPHDPKAYTMESMVGDIVAVLNSLRIKKVHYFGYSMGGMVGYHALIYAPSRFDSLILGGSTYPLHTREYAEYDVTLLIRNALEAALAENPQKPMESFIMALERKFGPLIEARRKKALANDALALVAAAQGIAETTSPLAEEILPFTALPCLIFAGEQDSWCASAARCAQIIPGARFFSLPKIDHIQALLRKDLTLPYIKPFLTGINKNSR